MRRLRFAVYVALASAVVSWGFAAPGQSKGDAAASPRVEQQDGFTVVGISVRTSNAKEREQSQIGKQWGRLMQENLLASIPNKADHNIVAVYTDYASDKDGEYTYILGARVSKADEVPAGMVVKQVIPGRYAVFTSSWRPGCASGRLPRTRPAGTARTRPTLSCTISAHKIRPMQ